MIATYDDFLSQKQVTAPPSGFDISPGRLRSRLFPWQKQLVTWAVKRGRAALFAECGLGKTFMELEWANIISTQTGGNVLILAPLAVAEQTVREGAKFDYLVNYCASQDDVRPGETRLHITNYERLHLFDPDFFQGVVLDESSILKAYMGKTKQQILRAFANTPYKLAGTATPAPNDHVELGNHAEFLGVMDAGEMLTRWFINDTKQAQNLRLKGHGARDFWRWVSTWAVCMTKPSDLLDVAGVPYSDEGFDLPALRIEEHLVGVDWSEGAESQGQLFRLPVLGATEMHREMRLTVDARAQEAVEIALASDEPCIVWCNTNYEADELMRLLPKDGSVVEVRGSDTNDEKTRKLNAFTEGTARYIVTKPTIAGFGLNWQHCHRMVFVGLSYSFEQTYQALRRSWRFGQSREVEAHMVVAETEGAIATAIARKQEEHSQMQHKMVEAMQETRMQESVNLQADLGPGIVRTVEGPGYTVHEGDSVAYIPSMPDNSIHFSIWSPPFSSLYTYTPSLRDMGNCESDEEFFEHFAFLLPQLWRVTLPGRLCAVHCKNLPMYKSKYGASGLRDFRGDVIRAFRETQVHQDAAVKEARPNDRWIYHSEVCIWKDPVREMQRTKTQGLLYKQIKQDASYSRQGLPDYLVIFRKWTEECDSAEPVLHAPSDFPLDVWQRYASPVWFDINQMDVLNERVAREDADEKHICPLQLGVIERAIDLWTNPGDVVLSPFMGIGSEGYVALQRGRRFVGVELKPAYFDWAVRNLDEAIFQNAQPNFLDLADAEATA